MEQKKVRATVRIAGRDYTIRGTESEEYIHRVAIHVNRKMEEVINAQPGLSTAMAAVLTALNLGDEVLKLKDEIQSLQTRINELEEEVSKAADEQSEPESNPPAVYDLSRKR
ncbi:MAG: cell division protein ZapA [Caldicoprobacterales bacterium]|jgi:cell division protein ZapA|nr:cell division protein ZapA [Clostridiales bacterium]